MIIITRSLRLGFSHLSTLNRYLQPVRINLTKTSQFPTLKLKSHNHLLRNWWSQSPFEVSAQKPMNVPVFSFLDGSYIDCQIELPQDIFNCPLRRDLIYRLYNYRINLNKFTTKKTRNRAETHGSGKKMRKQKGLGIARMGDKRAPHLYKGGKAHGAKPKVYSFPLNSKIKINALKALLSAKLAQGKIKIVDNEALSQGKTKFVAEAFNNHVNDERAIICVITGQDVDHNFQLAQRNFRRVIWHDSYSLDVMNLFRADKILITQKGLEELVENLYKTIYVSYRHPSMPKLQAEQEQKQEQSFDPQQLYEFKFKILAEYMDKYKKLQKEKPELLEREEFKAGRRSKHL